MEVSSHGIDQKRVLGLQFGAVVFTNLTRDHLDYHKTLESYFEVKARLFNGKGGATPRVAIVNLDDPYGGALLSQVPTDVRKVTFGEDRRAEVRAEDVTLDFRSTSFTLVWPGGRIRVESGLIG
ncbi:MAG TPA: Mur ligase family protein, partial [Opitutaceae bacterium]|nr:Mur ligase family protein [Opitutaceae bacterium]